MNFYIANQRAAIVEDDLFLSGIVDGLHARRMPGDQHVGHRGDGAEPVEPAGVVFDLFGPQKLGDDDGGQRHAYHRAVFGGHVVHVIGRLGAARPRHVLDDGGGVAGNVPCHMPGQNTGVEIVSAAWRHRDHEGYSVAFIEIGNGVRRCGWRGHREGHRGGRDRESADLQ